MQKLHSSPAHFQPAASMDSPALSTDSPALTMNSPALTMNSPASTMDSPALTMDSFEPKLSYTQDKYRNIPTVNECPSTATADPASALLHSHDLEEPGGSNSRRTSKSNSWFRELSSYPWLWEIVATVGSLSCLGAIVTILAKAKDKPLDEWTSRIQINTMVSMLTTAAKSLMLFSVASCVGQMKWIYFSKPRPLYHLGLFDDLGKGPLGAIQILLRVRWAAAYVGVMIVLLALAMDPFAQQVVKLDPTGVPTDDLSVWFGVTHNYSASAHRTAYEADTLGSNTIDVRMQGAILNGLFNLDIAPPYNCSSNCTWPDSLISLGFDSACKNVTLETIATKKCGKGHEGQYDAYPQCNMTTPNNVSISSGLQPTYWQTLVAVGTNSSLHNQTGKPDFNNISFISPDFLRAAVYRVHDDTPGYQELWGEEITECTISLVAYQYSDIRATGSNITFSSLEKTPLDSVNSSGNSTGSWATFNPLGLSPLSIRVEDLIAVNSFFISSAFTGTVNTGAAIDRALGVRTPFLTGDIAARFDAIAASMTNYIRVGPGSHRVPGTAITTVIFVRVMWRWLALPLFEGFAALGLLVWTIVRSRKAKGVGLWKSSGLALLFARYNRRDGLLLPDPAGPKAVKDLAKSVKARLS